MRVLVLSGARDDLEALRRERGDSHAPDASGGAGHEHGPARRESPAS